MSVTIPLSAMELEREVLGRGYPDSGAVHTGGSGALVGRRSRYRGRAAAH
ncbi:MAG: hypothetical protein WBZ37_27670 [Mycobacterium sp.]